MGSLRLPYSGRFSSPSFKLIERVPHPIKKALPRECERYTPRVPDKERGADLVLKITNGPAYR